MSDTSGKVHCRSSQLSKSLDEVLHDKDALAYFISYLQSVGADNLVRFWLDVEAFRLAADRTGTAELGSLIANHIRSFEPIQSTTDNPSAIRLPTVQPLPATRCSHVEKIGSPEDLACRVTPEVTQQQRAPTNYCGHASSSAGNSPKAVGLLPAHGEGVVSNTGASTLSSPTIPHLVNAPHEHCLTGSPQQELHQTTPSTAAFLPGSGRPLSDSCPASTPSITQVMLLHRSITVG